MTQESKIAVSLRFIVVIGIIAVFIALLPISVPDTLDFSDAPAQSYIVQGNDVERVAQLVEKHHGRVTSRLAVINSVGALLPEASLLALQAEDDIIRVAANASITVADAKYLNITPAQVGQPTADYARVIGANHVWAQGVTGRNVTVAVVDSGVVSTLPGINMDTGNRQRLVAWRDFVGDQPSAVPTDLNGHGSHVSGIVLSSQGSNDTWNGVAPNVDLVSVRVLNEQGAGTYEQVIQGIEWVIANKDLYNIKVMNLSIVAPPQSPYWADPLNQAVMQAWAAGITVVAAAGNGGPAPMTISVPGNNPYVITVGAFTDDYTPDDWSDDYIPPFSAAGPTLDGFVKPDVVAPGAHMLSTMQSSSRLASLYRNNRIGGTHFLMAGTSQATAVVSGLAALVLSQNPDLTPDQVKYRIMHTSLLWTDPETGDPVYSVWQQGNGRVNAPDAVFGDFADDLAANRGMDLQFDLDNPDGGYEGYSYYDEESGTFRLRDDPGWPSSYGSWAGGYLAWAGGYLAWAGGYLAWAGGADVWSGGYLAWAGGYLAWAGGYLAWAGGYLAWAGGYLAWAGSEPWAGRYDSPAFVASYVDGESPDVETTSMVVDEWIEERDWKATQFSLYLPFVVR